MKKKKINFFSKLSSSFFLLISFITYRLAFLLRRGVKRLVGMTFVIAASLLSSEVLYADDKDNKQVAIQIASMPLKDSIQILSKQTDALVLFPYDLVEGLEGQAVEGSYTAIHALQEMLAGTELEAGMTKRGVLTVSKKKPSEPNNNNFGNDENMRHKKRLLASIISLIASGASVAQAQTDTELEEVVVTGIRASVMDSIATKRDAKDIVDTISAEDIGKFPDTNIAESLQRITGVSIDRSGGEGQFITVRGLGPNFNTVLFNGRALATDTPDRSFSLDVLSADMIRAVNVYKSSNASITEGGIGGTVDIKTAKPFDFDGMKAVAGLGGIYSDSSEETDPQASFLVSNTFMDGKLGALLAGNYQKRTETIRAVENFQIVPGDLTLNRGPLWTWTPPEDRRVIPNVYRPQSLDRNVMTEERERTSVNFVTQYQFNEDAVLTFDALYSDFEVRSQGYTANTWFWYPTGEYEPELGGRDPVLDNETDRNVLFLQHGATGVASAYRDRFRPSDLLSTGLNLDWSITDKLTLNADVFTSQARNRNKGFDRQILVEGGSLGYVEYNYVPGSDYPTLSQNVAIEDVPLTDIDAAHYEAEGDYVEAENSGFKLDFEYMVDGPVISEVGFGLSRSENKKDNQEWEVDSAAGRIYKDTGTKIQPADFGLLEYVDIGGDWNGISDVVHGFTSVDDYLAWFTDPDTLALINSDPRFAGTTAEEVFLAAGGLNPSPTANSYEITETLTALYADIDLEFDIGVPLSVNLGARYVETDLSSKGTIQVLEDFELETPTPNQPIPLSLLPIYAGNGEYVSVSEDNSYSNVLPSLTATTQLTDDIVFRFAASKTLTRPNLDDVAPWLNLGGADADANNDGVNADTDGDGTVDNREDILGSGSGSNPQLRPYVSTNLDMSLEYYYREASAVSVAYFTKDVKDWIVTGSAIESVDLASLDSVPYNVSRPRNAEEAEISGIEFNWLHTFDSGFGVQANYTSIDSNIDLGTESDFSLEGLSDTANLVAFYENNSFQVRVAYNWRDSFLQDLIDPTGWTNEPVYVKEYEQIDFSMSYFINDTFTVVFDGINVTDEATRKHGRQENQFLEFIDIGPRYSLGLRAQF